MERYIGRIEVEDANGCRFEVHEYVERRRLRRFHRLILDTGESVRRIDPNTFIIIRTGETLVSVVDEDSAAPRQSRPTAVMRPDSKDRAS